MELEQKCKNCKKYEGDCGYHFTDHEKHIHYDCPRESCCDRFGNCNFYEEKRDKYQVQLDLLDEGKIGQMNTNILREALRRARDGKEE